MQAIFTIVLRQFVTMLVMIAGGFLLGKRRVLGPNATQELSVMSMQYLIPLSIALSFSRDFQPARLREWLSVFLLSSLAFGLIIGYATLRYPRRSPLYAQKRMCTVIPNNAAYGLLIAQSMFGAEGTYLLSAQIVVSNILLWTYGVAILSERPSPRKILLNPANLGVLCGLALALCPWKLPALVLDSLDTLAGIAAPQAMLLAGLYLARIDLRRVLASREHLLLALGKLIVGPLLIVPVLLLLHIERTAALVIFIGLIAPTGTAAAVFAEMCGQDNTFSTGSVAYNMTLSLVTIPLLLSGALLLFR